MAHPSGVLTAFLDDLSMFGSQHPHGASQLSGPPVPGVLTTSFGLHGHKYPHVHITNLSAKHAYI